MTAKRPQAIVLVSGGLDSATALAVARGEGFDCHALSFRYGQRHHVELDAARRVAEHLGAASHRIIDIDLRAFGASALTSDLEVPKHRDHQAMTAGIPITYVPARNTIFLSYALALAEVTGATHIFIGVNAVDYSGYPDCRPEFIAAFQELTRLATKVGVEQERPMLVETPLISLTKREIIELGLSLGVDYGLTHSCYDPAADGRPCGACDSCLLRARGFAEAGVPDPALR